MAATAISFIHFSPQCLILFYYTRRHKERLALIEKGADASLFNTGKEASKSGNKLGKLL